MGVFLKNTWDLLLKGGMLLVGFLSGAAAGADGVTLLLVGLMLTDYVSGVLAGALARGVGGRKPYGWRALLQKALILLLVLLGSLLDSVTNQGESMFRSAITLFYISHEAVSLLEHLNRLGLPVPRRLRRMLQALGEEEGDEAAERPQNG